MDPEKLFAHKLCIYRDSCIPCTELDIFGTHHLANKNLVCIPDNTQNTNHKFYSRILSKEYISLLKIRQELQGGNQNYISSSSQVDHNLNKLS